MLPDSRWIRLLYWTHGRVEERRPAKLNDDREIKSCSPIINKGTRARSREDFRRPDCACCFLPPDTWMIPRYDISWQILALEITCCSCITWSPAPSLRRLSPRAESVRRADLWLPSEARQRFSSSQVSSILPILWRARVKLQKLRISSKSSTRLEVPTHACKWSGEIFFSCLVEINEISHLNEVAPVNTHTHTLKLKRILQPVYYFRVLYRHRHSAVR